MSDLLSGQLLISTLVLGAVYGLIALGLNLIYGTMRLLNVAHGEVLMLGGYFAFWMFTLTGIGPIYSMLIAFVLAGLLGAGLYYFVCERVLKSFLRPMMPFRPPVIPISVMKAVPSGKILSSAVYTWVCVPTTALTCPSKNQPIATFSDVASA